MKAPTIHDITPGIKSGVGGVLMARAYAETMRAQVDAVHREILTECPVYADRWGETHQILNSGDLYKSSDEVLCRDFYDEANHRLRKVGLKPQSMHDDHCPALVAERLLTIAESALIEAAAEVFEGITVNRLICAGLDKYRRWVDMLCRVVVNLPDFKNPLTGEVVT